MNKFQRTERKNSEELEAFALEKYRENQNTHIFLEIISEKEDTALRHLDATEDVSFRINIHASKAADSSPDSLQTYRKGPIAFT